MTNYDENSSFIHPDGYSRHKDFFREGNKKRVTLLVKKG